MVFKGDEDAYFSWLTTHPKGYILDTLSVPSNKHLILHSAKCRTIGKPPNAALSPLPDEDRSIKICAEDVQGLSDWINEQGLEDLSKQCELCNPRGKPTHRRFTWARDELILALDLYFTSPAARSNVRHPGIVELSELLQELPIHPVELRPPNFRNPNGVAMKLGNFLVYDPRYTGTGLQQGAQMEQAIWNELSGDLPRLRETASAIREHYPILKSAGIQHIIEDDGVGACQGSCRVKQFRMHFFLAGYAARCWSSLDGGLSHTLPGACQALGCRFQRKGWRARAAA